MAAPPIATSPVRVAPVRAATATAWRAASRDCAEPSRPTTIERGNSSVSPGRARSTEHGAEWTSAVATLPSRIPGMRRWPWLPIATTVAFRTLASTTESAAGGPVTIPDCTLTPAGSTARAASIPASMASRGTFVACAIGIAGQPIETAASSFGDAEQRHLGTCRQQVCAT